MKITVHDSMAIYRRIIATEDPTEKQAIYLNELLMPFEGMFQRFGMPLRSAPLEQIMGMVNGWGMLAPESLDATTLEAIRLLEDAGAQRRTEAALIRASVAAAPYADRFNVSAVECAILLADPARDLPGNMRGYAGFGGIPGYIMPVFSQPNAYNLARIEPITAHEFHHNVMFSAFPFNPMTVTVADYIIYEGLAESFATSLYGEALVGFFVEDVAPDDLERARTIIGGALDVSGFDKVRGYIFGDDGAAQWGYEAVGVPQFGGYAVGYHAVQAYLRKTGLSVLEATFVHPREIIAKSGYFELVR